MREESEMVDLTEDGDKESKPDVHARAASIADQQDMVALLQEQLRQARDGLARRQASLDAIKRESSIQPFSAYNYFKPGEVVDLTDL